MQSLQNKIYISTRPKEQAASLEKLLSSEGAKVLSMPTIAIEEEAWNDKKTELLHTIWMYHWLVFTSVNGVRYFFKKMESINGNFLLPIHIKIAVVGKKTAEEVLKYGHTATFVNPGNTGEELAKTFQQQIKPNEHILLCLGNLARQTLENALKGKVEYTRLDVYRTVMPAEVNQEAIEAILDDKYDLIILTSPSAFRNLLTILDGKTDVSRLRLASIGSTTTAEIQQFKMNPSLTAIMANAQGIFEAIIEETKKKI